MADTEARAPYPARYFDDEAPTRAVVTRPVRWTGELDATAFAGTRVSSPLVSGPLGALPDALYPANPRRRIKRNEWMLLVAAISIVGVLVLVAVFGLLGLSPSSGNDTQSVGGAAGAPVPTPSATVAPTPTVTPVPVVESSFVTQDATTQGNWQARYGGQGYMVVGDTQQLPSSVQVTPANQQETVWQSSTDDPRALQMATDPTHRVAACWYASGSFTIDVNVTDGQTYQLALYVVDWDQQNRAEIINVLDPTTDAVLDTRSVTAFTNGEYLVWNVRGHISIQITNVPSSVNAVVSGVFIAPVAAPGAAPLSTPSGTSTPTLVPTSSPDATPDASPTDTPAA